MRTPTTSEFVTIWERGLERLPFERALDLLEAACPERSRKELMALSIGQRDSLLFALREKSFGASMTVLASCPQCQQPLEMEMETLQLCGAGDVGSGALPEDVSITVPNHEYRLRAPNTADLASAAGMDSESASSHILSRCLSETIPSGASIPIIDAEITKEVADKALAAIVTLDPVADISLQLSCASCAHNWSERFDIVSFFWAELEGLARRILREVHELAINYGWSEAEIMALSPLRRQFYLEMTGV
jgi:hypothetical protein